MSFNFKFFYILIYFTFSSKQFIISYQDYDAHLAALVGATRSNALAVFNNSTVYRNDELSLAKYVVSLRDRDRDVYFGVSHFCGGSIIKPNVILTAAHCLFRDNTKRLASSIAVAAKTPIRLKRTEKSEIMRVEKVIIHQKYSRMKKVNDIGILILRHGIVLDNILAANIQLPTIEIEDTTQCSVLGWGRLYVHGPLANKLLYIDVFVHHRQICKLYYKILGETHICASDFFDPEKNPCTGDSGGPLICDGVMVGIVSFGNLHYPGVPTVYTNVYEFLDWITQNCGKNLFSVKTTNFVLIAVVVKIVNKLLYF